MANNPSYDPWLNNYLANQKTKPGQPPASEQAATAVAAPSGSTPTAIPGEGIYGAQSALAQRAYEEAQNNIKQQRLGIYNEYGFDPTGKNLDPNNPYGLVQQDHNAHAMQLDTAREEALGRNLGETGLGAQVEEAPLYQQGVEDSRLQKGYLDSLHGNDQEMLAAKSQLQQALLDARAQQIQAAISNGDFTPAVEPGPTPAAAKPGVSWGGRQFTQRQALAQWLAQHGSTYKGWARNHPSAATKLK